MESIVDNHPKYLIINPIFEGMQSVSRKFSNEIDERFFIKITRIKNIVKELYKINKNLNNPKIRKII